MLTRTTFTTFTSNFKEYFVVIRKVISYGEEYKLQALDVYFFKYLFIQWFCENKSCFPKERNNDSKHVIFQFHSVNIHMEFVEKTHFLLHFLH